ncbi:hypothetical protein D3C76_1473660 [compost metagenome]
MAISTNTLRAPCVSMMSTSYRSSKADSKLRSRRRPSAACNSKVLRCPARSLDTINSRCGITVAVITCSGVVSLCEMSS